MLSLVKNDLRVLIMIYDLLLRTSLCEYMIKQDLRSNKLDVTRTHYYKYK